jgi:DNA-binding response OmpR family regulator
MKTRPTTGRFLVVDDDEGTTQTFALILKLEGHQVSTACSAEAGLREADAVHRDAIIIDLRMPFINGLGFLYRLREREAYRDTPVAIVTGDCGINDALKEELCDLGVKIRYKPIGIEDLVDLADSLLGGGGVHPPLAS